MSIIQEALKKVQVRIEDGVKTAPVRKEDVVIQSAVKENIPLSRQKERIQPFFAKDILKISAIALSALVAVAALWLAASAVKMLKARLTPEPSVKAEGLHQQVIYKPLPSVTELDAKAAKPVEELKVIPPPQLTLNGIMYVENRPRAIINGIIVEEGDMVNDAEVRKINRANVILNFRNTEITINLQ